MTRRDGIYPGVRPKRVTGEVPAMADPAVSPTFGALHAGAPHLQLPGSDRRTE